MGLRVIFHDYDSLGEIDGELFEKLCEGGQQRAPDAKPPKVKTT